MVGGRVSERVGGGRVVANLVVAEIRGVRQGVGRAGINAVFDPRIK
jgi:hypothetical protein